MARELTDQEHEELADRLSLHLQQAREGLIPADSPPDFVRPEGEDALIDGRPWWWGPADSNAETIVDGGGN